VHIGTNEYYACKVINKKLMEGREYMVRNEIAVLKKISKAHKNIVTLHDYFEVRRRPSDVTVRCVDGPVSRPSTTSISASTFAPAASFSTAYAKRATTTNCTWPHLYRAGPY
jgi:serine/threonine protein kinase